MLRWRQSECDIIALLHILVLILLGMRVCTCYKEINPSLYRSINHQRFSCHRSVDAWMHNSERYAPSMLISRRSMYMYTGIAHLSALAFPLASPIRRSFFTTHLMLSTRHRCSSSDTHMNSKLMRTAFNDLVDVFRASSVSEAEASARYLLCHVTGIGYRYSTFQNKLDRLIISSNQLLELDKLAQQRLQHIPIQYIIGNWDFFGLTLACEPPILIPRPETEELVQLVIDSGVLAKLPSPKMLDIGIGTGAIGIALLTAYPTATCAGIDIHENAIKLASKNVATHKLSSRYETHHQSFSDFVHDAAADEHKQHFDLILSNPPYIPTNELDELQREVRHEDVLALDGGADGLDIVRDIVQHGPSLLSKHGSREIWLEVARHHPAMVQEWVRNDPNLQLIYEDVQSINDLSGYPRFIRLRCHRNHLYEPQLDQ
jgi:release factor glutamine methyltransferase